MQDLSSLAETPATLDEAVNLIIKQLDPQEVEFALSHSPCEVHHTFGRYLRNTWGLWQKDSPLATWFREKLEIGHADDMSGIILDCVWKTLQHQPWNLPSQVKKYHRHWKMLGVDPITQERI